MTRAAPGFFPVSTREGRDLPSSVPILAAVVLGLYGPPGDPAPENRSRTTVSPAKTAKRDPEVSRVVLGEEPGEVPAEIADEVKQIEIEHRTMLSGAVESWRLDPVRHRYEFLLKRAVSPAAKHAIERRLVTLARHEEMVRSSRRFEMVLQASRRRDKQVAATRRVLTELEKPQRRPYVAQGLIQPSSRQVDGHRVFALIGPEGRPVAYLDVPPGLDARPVLSKRVGVRGSIHYDETLGAKLIAVRDIESLE